MEKAALIKATAVEEWKSSDRRKLIFVKSFLAFSILFIVSDFIYKCINNISYVNRDECIINSLLPRFWFLFFEYFVELTALVFFGITLAVFLEAWFSKYKKFYPRNMLSAFVYASILPVCACSAIPLIRSLRGKLSFASIVAFVVSAPLLSPQIIVLSMTVIGPRYTVLRIVCAFILAASAGIVLSFFSRKSDHGFDNATMLTGGACQIMGSMEGGPSSGKECSGCSQRTADCGAEDRDLFLKVWGIFREVIIYILVAGAAGITLEYFPLNRMLVDYDIGNSFTGILLVVLIGIPVYFCSGTEVLFIRTLMHANDFAMGTAIAFSLSSTAICLTSMIMLIKFLGKRNTAILALHVFGMTLLMGYLLNFLPDL